VTARAYSFVCPCCGRGAAAREIVIEDDDDGPGLAAFVALVRCEYCRKRYTVEAKEGGGVKLTPYKQKKLGWKALGRLLGIR